MRKLNLHQLKVTSFMTDHKAFAVKGGFESKLDSECGSLCGPETIGIGGILPGGGPLAEDV